MPRVTDPTTRVVCWNVLLFRGVAADGNGHLSHTEHIDHVELPGQEREAAVMIRRGQLNRERIRRLVLQFLDAIRHRKHWFCSCTDGYRFFN